MILTLNISHINFSKNFKQTKKLITLSLTYNDHKARMQHILKLLTDDLLALHSI